MYMYTGCGSRHETKKERKYCKRHRDGDVQNWWGSADSVRVDYAATSNSASIIESGKARKQLTRGAPLPTGVRIPSARAYNT